MSRLFGKRLYPAWLVLIVYILFNCAPVWARCESWVTSGWYSRVFTNFTSFGRDGYKSAALGHSGVETSNGSQASIGAMAIVEFTPSGKPFRRIEGVVLEAYPAGVTIQEADGTITECNSNYGSIGKAWLKPLPIPWKRIGQYKEYKNDLTKYRDPIGLVTIYDTRKNTADKVFGRIRHVGGTEFKVTDSVGREHLFDPFHYLVISEVTESTREVERLYKLFKPPKDLVTKLKPAKDRSPEKLAREAVAREKIKEMIRVESTLGFTGRLPVETGELPLNISEEQQANLIHNLELMGIDKKTYPSEVIWIEGKDWPAMFRQAVSNQARHFAPAKDLGWILIGKWSTSRELRAALDAWAIRFKVPFRFLFRKEVDELGPLYSEVGLIHDGSQAVAPNGFIDSTFYAQMVNDGFYPLVDPHDPIGHLATLADRDFTDNFFRINKLIHLVESRLEFPNRFSFTKLAELENEKINAYVAMQSQLNGTVRDVTHENWTYLQEDGSLFMQGNGPFNGIYNGAFKRNAKLFVKELLNIVDLDRDIIGIEELAQLPRFADFMKNEVNVRAYETYKDEIFRQRMLNTTMANLQAKVLKWASAQDLFKGATRATNEEVQFFLKQFEQYCSHDSELQQFYNHGVRVRFYAAAIDFYTRYEAYISSTDY